MKLFYVDIKMQGRNRALLFKRLKKHNINVYRVKSVNEKELIIRVSPKDNKKVFAFFNDMWYNNIIKISTALKAVRLIKRRWLFVVCLLLSFAAVCAFDGVYFDFELKGDTLLEEREISAVFDELDIKKYRTVTDSDIARIKDAIFSKYDTVGFVDVKQVSHRIIIEVVDKLPDVKSQPPQRDLYADQSGQIYNVIVHRGRALKAVGENVEVGQKLVEGVIAVGENEFETYCLATVVLKKEFVFEKTYNKDSSEFEAEAVAIACFLCGDNEIIEKNVIKTAVGDGVNYAVTVAYLTVVEQS